ncbi:MULTISPECIES: N-acetylmannosamine kinase [Edwardsiella]|uniref:N-acetylmannosamine kinase n=2 Tax=Edwardsiella anguillarum TaxID=1821960 RepID=A0A076LQ67_9GAMM|nr:MULTISPECIES: N-acetylmannosamine kinase [Edwardsiella]AKM45972.1 N-acetylmannosamine kinase [Edwardsiella sp. EA181011]GAJ66976.1 N-acetylmannosamine kinase [Edwardsiella piscicida]AIJ08723.1 N-acetylmannosamine kinase [Edwardsiella anguillarum ET080813]AKR76753.1 N-acetylmannosamine kinase [Edwardsiella sp. LADL05-105]KAB0592837.1 N-acetylmannosamine kinase [Edwardsiella anguillarum]
MNTLAIDLGGTKLAAALVDTNGQLSQRCEVATPVSGDPEALTQALSQLITHYRGMADRVAVASTGIIHQGILSALNPDNLGGLNRFPLQACVERLSALPCHLLNDAQAAAWAEYLALTPSGQDMAFITVSTGVGGGLVLNGRLQIGRAAFAGHIGHTLADPAGPRCGCGRSGCVESIASGRAIAAAAQGDLAGLDARAIFQRAAAGDAQAQRLIARSAQAIAQLIADLRATLDIQCAVIGGSVGLAPGYLAQVQHFLRQMPHAYHATLYSARHQRDAGLIGAALWSRRETT